MEKQRTEDSGQRSVVLVNSLDFCFPLSVFCFNHRLLSKRFTFAVYYSAESGTAYVRAVLVTPKVLTLKCFDANMHL
jgi:hypothetical protein